MEIFVCGVLLGEKLLLDDGGDMGDGSDRFMLFLGVEWFKLNFFSVVIIVMGNWLVVVGCNKYSVGFGL